MRVSVELKCVSVYRMTICKHHVKVMCNLVHCMSFRFIAGEKWRQNYSKWFHISKLSIVNTLIVHLNCCHLSSEWCALVIYFSIHFVFGIIVTITFIATHKMQISRHFEKCICLKPFFRSHLFRFLFFVLTTTIVRWKVWQHAICVVIQIYTNIQLWQRAREKDWAKRISMSVWC